MTINLKRETESLSKVAQNNSLMMNYIKAKTDNTQKNNKCSLRGERDETVNHKINKCRKLAQKEYNTRYDWVGKMIYWELYKILIWPCLQMLYAKPKIFFLKLSVSFLAMSRSSCVRFRLFFA